MIYLQTFYVTVNASTEDGDVVASSNGLTILPVDVPVEGVEIFDGFPCLLTGIYHTGMSGKK